jgi:hypothetical protein
MSIALPCDAQDSDEDIGVEMNKRIDAWTEFLKLNPRLSSVTSNQYYRDIVDLGMSSVPYLMERIQKGNWALGGAVYQITKKRFEESEWPPGRLGDSISAAKLLIDWWPKARKDSAKKFENLRAEWQNLQREGKKDQSQEKYTKMRNLGLATLPVIMEKVAAGDRELVPLVSQLTTAKVDPNASIEQCVSWWEQNKEQWLIPFPNKRPTANAGKDQQVVSGATVLLDGSGSTDEDKDKLTYQWRQTAGPTVELSDAKAVQPRFTAPKVDKETTLVFELAVNDGSPKKQVHPACQSGQSDPDTVTIIIRAGN